MADEDVEMENFSEDRAETASDFTADDENEKVTRLKFSFLRRILRRRQLSAFVCKLYATG